jgi:cytochrome c oxidase subunit III
MSGFGVAEQFGDRAQQDQSASLGMWTFLGTEVLFFGGMFTAYTVYRTRYGEAFAEASKHLYCGIGAANTAILLVSSVFVALAVQLSARGGRRKATAALLTIAAMLGLAFLSLKGFENALDYRERLVPTVNFEAHGRVDPGPEEMFYVIYFIMTGIHALHLTIGVVIMLVLAARLLMSKKTLEHQHNTIEMSGLYWHFVDVVWLFLFPLLYQVV